MFVTREWSELDIAKFEKRAEEYKLGISAPANDPESKFYWLVKFLQRLQGTDSKKNQSYDETSKNIDALLIEYNHDQIDLDHSIGLLISEIILFAEYFSQSKYKDLSSREIYNTPYFFSPDENLATHSKIFDDYMFRRKIDHNDNFFDLNSESVDLFMEMIPTAFISFPELLRSDKIENIEMQNKKDAEQSLARELLINFEKLFNKIKKEGQEDLLFEILQYMMSDFLERAYVSSKKEDKKNLNYFEKIPNEGLLAHADILLNAYDDKINGPKIKKLRKKLDKLGGIPEIGGSSDSKMEEDFKKREAFLKTVHKDYLRYMTFENTPEKLKDLKKLIRKTNHDDKDFDYLREFLSMERHWYLLFQQYYLPDDIVESLLKQKKWVNRPAIDFVPEQIKFPKNNLKAYNELKILIIELINVIDLNPFIAIELIKQSHNREKEKAIELIKQSHNREKEKEALEKEALFWLQINSLISTKLQSIIDAHLFSIMSSMSRVLMYLHGVFPYRNKGSLNRNTEITKINEDLRSLIQYFQNHLKQLVNADCEDCDGDEDRYENGDKRDECESESKEPILMNLKLLIWEIINNFKAIESNINLGNSIYYCQSELTYEQIYFLSRKIEKQRILSSDNVNDYISLKLPKKNYLKDKYNFLRLEKASGHLIAKDKKTKNKNGQVGNRFEMKHVLSWLKERRGIDVYMFKPDYSLDRDLNINDFFTFFFREL